MSPLAELNAALRARGAGGELPSVGRFREAWARSQATVDVQRALVRVPANAGPLNSHALVLQSFALLQELSPEALRRMVEVVEALDTLERIAMPAQRTPRAGKPARAPARRR